MSENKLPQWAIDGLREAGLSAEGWEPHDLPDWVVWNREPHRFEVCERGEWLDILGPDGESVAFEVESVPEAFRLAARLAAALENKPDPRVAELEAEVARLKAALTPSAETKAAYMGEFGIPLEFVARDGTPKNAPKQVTVPWTTIKEIMGAILAKAALSEATNGE